MAKVFTITEGLENLGALRTGGQGSVYKGKRIGEIHSAVKLLPTPIHTEDKNDKNYRDYINEVEKLKKVNEVPNPNVVKILSSGLTESGSFPFIEMEFIEGPDLEDLLRPPHDPVFSVPEVIKVAEQLSNALAHCHKVGVKHGDVKSNNVKFNIYTGNYVLLDFGLAITSDEQRRTSLRNAGAIEFMAPEQNEGEMLFQSDIYSFGVILYELLAGRVPFPLEDKGETARNKVMLSHLENPIPDVMTLRKEHLPKTWDNARVEREMRVPEWLLSIISKCLQKDPAQRFNNGVELHDTILNSRGTDPVGNDALVGINLRLEKENEELKEQLKEYQKKEIQHGELPVAAAATGDRNGISLSKPVFALMVLMLVGLLAYALYTGFSSGSGTTHASGTDLDSVSMDTMKRERRQVVSQSRSEEPVQEETNVESDPQESPQDSTATGNRSGAENVQKEPAAEPVPQTPSPAKTETSSPTNNEVPRLGKYTLSASRAYIYDGPEEGTRTNNFLTSGNRAELTAIDDQKGFIYVAFFDNNGQITKGWLRKRDLRRL